jgi:hypothetical protein
MELYTKPQFEQLLANGRAAAIEQEEDASRPVVKWFTPLVQRHG